MHMERTGKFLFFAFSSGFNSDLAVRLWGSLSILPIIMMGVALSKWKVVERANEMKGRIVILTVIALAFGIWIKALPHIGEPTADIMMLQDSFGGVILAAGYVGIMLFALYNSII